MEDIRHLCPRALVIDHGRLRFDGARFPVTYFRRPMREVLTYVVRGAFATTFPAQALLGEADYRLLPLGVALSGAALWAANRFWHFALRRYSSASS